MSTFTETDLVRNLADLLKMCRETSRALAHMRKDPAWMDVSQHFEGLEIRLIKLARTSSRILQ